MYQLIYVLAIRSESESFFRLGLWSNYRLTCAVMMGAVLQFAVVFLPLMNRFFHTVPLSLWDLLIGLVISTFAFWQIEQQKLMK